MIRLSPCVEVIWPKGRIPRAIRVDRAQVAGGGEVCVVQNVEHLDAELRVESLGNRPDVVVLVYREVDVEQARANYYISSQIAPDVGARRGGQCGVEASPGTVAIGRVRWSQGHQGKAIRIELEQPGAETGIHHRTCGAAGNHVRRLNSRNHLAGYVGGKRDRHGNAVRESRNQAELPATEDLIADFSEPVGAG